MFSFICFVRYSCLLFIFVCFFLFLYVSFYLFVPFCFFLFIFLFIFVCFVVFCFTNTQKLADKNWAQIRRALANVRPPTVPYIGVFLTDLTFLDESDADYVDLRLEAKQKASLGPQPEDPLLRQDRAINFAKLVCFFFFFCFFFR